MDVKEIRLDGLKAFAKGGTGECFRIEDDKILARTIEQVLIEKYDIDKAYDGVEKGEFTDKIFVLDGRAFYKGK